MTPDTDRAAPGPGGGINWREHARQLALALGNHRTDMHRESNRPCATCRFSKQALDAYLNDVERDRAVAARTSAGGSEGE